MFGMKEPMLRNLLWTLLYSRGMELPPLTWQTKEIIVSIVIGIIIMLLYVPPVRLHRTFFVLSQNSAQKARSSALWFLSSTAVAWIILSLDIPGMFIPKYMVANILTILVLTVWLFISMMTLIGLLTDRNR